jgi:hypothetical protein
VREDVLCAERVGEGIAARATLPAAACAGAGPAEAAWPAGRTCTGALGNAVLRPKGPAYHVTRTTAPDRGCGAPAEVRRSGRPGAPSCARAGRRRESCSAERRQTADRFSYFKTPRWRARSATSRASGVTPDRVRTTPRGPGAPGRTAEDAMQKAQKSILGSQLRELAPERKV